MEMQFYLHKIFLSIPGMSEGCALKFSVNRFEFRP